MKRRSRIIHIPTGAPNLQPNETIEIAIRESAAAPSTIAITTSRSSSTVSVAS